MVAIEITDKSMVNTDANTYMWLGFIEWATTEIDFVNAFLSETGEKLIRAPRNALEAMIDKTTGADQHNIGVMKKFVCWVTENHWGLEYAPPLFFEKFKNQEDG